MTFPQNSPDPSPAEIAERCQEIQATWSAREERSRRGIKRELKPTGPVPGIRIIATADIEGEAA